MSIGCVRDILEGVSTPLGHFYSNVLCCRHFKHSDNLPDSGPLGSRDELLTALAMCARLVYGSGQIQKEIWGFLDPPLNGEAWSVVDQVCETKHSKHQIQAACYVKDGPAASPIAIVAYRGTVSRKGILQDIALGVPITRLLLKKVIGEASTFYLKCADKHKDKKIYVVGHSLGGLIAESVASYNDVDGAAFNSPGPWSTNPVRNLTGRFRPEFEVHLTRDDPLAFSFFPKPENSRHISVPIWHPGNNHRICAPYMKEVSHMVNVHPNCQFYNPRTMVNQVELMELDYPPPIEIEDCILYDDESESDGSDSDTLN
ncbi:unnamed protein product [Polarella glacialis]|uniref:Fungal lipase-like domain-containing protein n=1 Tax=Polarella glacialis TaxID=89957 RepID=A0A813DYC1_POLGL|nr:unnamed protein product [Polarella glacialis]CAE8710523.1 unnamed protein product [Polarella glacialis]|mmetsp:Transcript_25702/g.41191  ORF Transcript_25702/g.41191 Transcript_25702/m.41191 type:complete len:315 (-) Transcript_25702:10-954(-)